MDLLDRCLAITPIFEGGGYDNLSDNFDGMGISAGILQWCLGQGSLQAKILKPYLSRHGSIDALKIFPGKVDFLVNITNAAAIEYAVKTMHVKERAGLFKTKQYLDRNWALAWKTFLKRPDVIALQREACVALYQGALRLREEWGMTSDFSLFWFFDILTQNGSLKGILKPIYDLKEAEAVINRADPKCRSEWHKVDLKTLEKERVILLIASHRRALLSKSAYYNDVLVRKGTIALGRGYVHGRPIVIT